MKPLKMKTEGGKWYIEDRNGTVEFDNSKDAWLYISIAIIIRAVIITNSTITASRPYPVRSLVPHPIRGV